MTLMEDSTGFITATPIKTKAIVPDVIKVHHVDVRTAFLNAKMDKEMYINLSDGTEPGEAHETFRLNLALYGTKQTGRLLGINLDKELKAMGAVRSNVYPCLYSWK